VFTVPRATMTVFALALGASAQAATINVTATNLKGAFLAARSGDTIIVTGTAAGASLVGRSFAKPVTIDVSSAVFTDTVTFKDVAGVNVIGGRFGSATASMRSGRAVAVYDSSRVTLTTPAVIGNGLGHGITVSRSADVAVVKADFTNLRLGLGILASRQVRVTNSRFTGMTSDGINIADSHKIMASDNRCSGSKPSLGAHPDCIQLWSVRGNPVQSDITLTRNVVEGATQGLTSFNADDGGGLRITMIDNVITTSFPQGLACYNCVDSVFRGNVLNTLQGAKWQTTMNIIGGRNNSISNNSIGPRPTTLSAAAARGFSASAEAEFDPMFLLGDADYRTDDDADLGEAFDVSSGFGSAAAAVPEPMVWTQLLLGFGFAGAALRRRRATLAG